MKNQNSECWYSFIMFKFISHLSNIVFNARNTPVVIMLLLEAVQSGSWNNKLKWRKVFMCLNFYMMNLITEKKVVQLMLVSLSFLVAMETKIRFTTTFPLYVL